jgi:predicted O-linked N-acetylglucosamine transferase (SPINDLY family)
MLIRHPVAHLIPELIEKHDRSRFDVIGISHGPNEPNPEQQRLRSAFDELHDVATQNDFEIASTLQRLEVDIAIDLSGYTERGRTYLLALRPAPIAVSYLGYPGSTGTDFIDYIIADETVLPFDQEPYYTEKIVHLPDGFMVCDAARNIPGHAPSRREAGLPENGFVFCSFNGSYKIAAPVFDIWMRLLQHVDGSVLWLLHSNDDAMGNLRREAEQRGVDSARIIFAPKVSPADHLARMRLADLFLDTQPVNAGATAIDALSAGLPVLTCTGHTFVGRVAASILRMAGLPELVTTNAEDYEALARKLATDPQLLRSIRGKLEGDRSACRLFDTDRFRRHLESAFSTMLDIHLRGEEPRSFRVDPVD